MIGNGLDDLIIPSTFIPGTGDEAPPAAQAPVSPARTRLDEVLPHVEPAPRAESYEAGAAGPSEPAGVAPQVPVPAVVPQAASAPQAPQVAAASHAPQAASAPQAPQAPSTPATHPVAPPGVAAPTREQRLTAALHTLRRTSPDVEAAALVSLDGFMMASALPSGMHEDRVGAMSAAILGLGERAAIELGKGRLSQVFIEGDTGYVLLMAAGDRAVLTVLARLEVKLGLLIYDMREAANSIAEILG